MYSNGHLFLSSDKLDKCPAVKDYRITVRFPAELRRRLKDVAHRTRTRESDLVRGAVERQLAAEEHALTAYEQVKKAGLIAAVRGAPPDLSTNPKHFEDFGKSSAAGYWSIPDRSLLFFFVRIR